MSSTTAPVLLASDCSVPAGRRARGMRAGVLAAMLLAPSLVFLALFTYWPIIRVAIDALTVRAFRGPSQWGFGNFERLFADAHFHTAVLNNLVYAVGSVLPSILLGLAFAMGLRSTTRLNGALRTLITLPMLIPLIAAASLFIFILLPGAGLLDYYLAKLALPGANWLGDPSLALGSIIGITIWKNTGYYMLFFLAGLAGIPHDLLDAARIDGASAYRRFRHVTLPLLGPTIGFVLVIALLNVLTQVDHIVVMTRGGPSDATLTVLYYIYQTAHQNMDIGLASAATLVSVAFLLVLSLLSLRTLERGIHYES